MRLLAKPVLSVRQQVDGLTLIGVPAILNAACPGNVGGDGLSLLGSEKVSIVFVTENGRTGASVDLTPLADQIHILTACDLLLPSPVERLNLTGLPCAPIVTHGDGSLVSATKPAKAGEQLVAYAVGLGATNPPAATGQRAATALPTAEFFIVDYNYHPNALPAKPQVFRNTGETPPNIAPFYSGLTPAFVGLYQINFFVMGNGIPACDDITTLAPGASAIQSNLTVSFGGAFSFDGAGICVAPGS